MRIDWFPARHYTLRTRLSAPQVRDRLQARRVPRISIWELVPALPRPDQYVIVGRISSSDFVIRAAERRRNILQPVARGQCVPQLEGTLIRVEIGERLAGRLLYLAALILSGLAILAIVVQVLSGPRPDAGDVLLPFVWLAVLFAIHAGWHAGFRRPVRGQEEWLLAFLTTELDADVVDSDGQLRWAPGSPSA